MKEQLYTIPVNDAFATDCECPICMMYKELEKNAVDFTMGPSYMEDDVRAATDQMGFCTEHLRKIMAKENKLGISLVLHSHMVKINNDIKKITKTSTKPSTLFKKKDVSKLTGYLEELNKSCYVCKRIEDMYKRYIRTIHYLWEKDEAFRKKYAASKGFCTKHYQDLIEQAPINMSGSSLDEFIDTTNKIYMDNMERVTEDLSWFIDKFDYIHKDDPWKNAKDALPRAITKLNTIDGNDKFEKKS